MIVHVDDVMMCHDGSDYAKEVATMLKKSKENFIAGFLLAHGSESLSNQAE